jgi:hypothetical protein
MTEGRRLRATRVVTDDRRGRRFVSFLASTTLLAIAWTLPAATNVLMDLLFNEGAAAKGSMWAQIVTSAVPWYVWVPLTPAVVRLTRKRPVMWPLSMVNLAAHTALLAAVTLVFAGTLRIVNSAMGLPPSHAGLVRNALGWAPFTLLCYAAVVGIAQAVMFAKRAREAAIEQAVLAEMLARAQLDTLRMQLHPHFLFNALNTISMLVRDQDADTAIRLIAELGDILRELLRDPTATVAPLRGEIKLVRQYLSIEQVRFGARLVIEWNVDPELLGAAVPPLILQPVVENAIRHGVARGSGIGLLRIEAVARADTLVLSVYDNGPGDSLVTQGANTDTASGHHAGLGLINTRMRLEQIYGDRAYFRLARTDNLLTLATIAMPLTFATSLLPGPAPAAARERADLTRADARAGTDDATERWV